MQLHNLQPRTLRKGTKRVGRGGKRGTFSGGGSKGQKSRAGAGVKPGFRGGDDRIWQVFPKMRGASKKPGNSRPHRKHRFYQYRAGKPLVLNVSDLNVFHEGDIITPALLFQNGMLQYPEAGVKILGGGSLAKKLTIKDIKVSESARTKITQIGGTIQ